MLFYFILNFILHSLMPYRVYSDKFNRLCKPGNKHFITTEVYNFIGNITTDAGRLEYCEKNNALWCFLVLEHVIHPENRSFRCG